MGPNRTKIGVLGGPTPQNDPPRPPPKGGSKGGSLRPPQNRPFSRGGLDPPKKTPFLGVRSGGPSDPPKKPWFLGVFWPPDPKNGPQKGPKTPLFGDPPGGPRSPLGPPLPGGFMGKNCSKKCTNPTEKCIKRGVNQGLPLGCTFHGSVAKKVPNTHFWGFFWLLGHKDFPNSWRFFWLLLTKSGFRTFWGVHLGVQKPPQKPPKIDPEPHRNACT